MASLVTAAGKLVSAVRCDDDFADRLSFRYTVAALVVFALLVTTKQYVGEPIECWAPAHFSKTHVAYAKDFCWIRNTYYLPKEEEIPKDGPNMEAELTQRGGRSVMFYQWVPIVLLIQALFFYAPCAIWQSFGDNSGIDVGNLITEGQLLATVQMEDEVRQKIIKKMVRQVDRYLAAYSGGSRPCTMSLKYVLSRSCCGLCGRSRTNYLVALYMFVKALYVVNVVGQLFLLDAFLGTAYHTYGVEVLRAVANGDDWTASPRFPRVTMCDMKVRRLGNLHRYTIQCVLPINLFNEKIYLFLWFWMVFVAAVTCITALAWLIKLASGRDRRRYIRRYLNVAGRVNLEYKRDQEKMGIFTEKYLRQDGVFMVRMMTAAANGLTAVELTAGLWDFYWKTHTEPTQATHASAPPYDETLPRLNGRYAETNFGPSAADTAGATNNIDECGKNNNDIYNVNHA